jgi:hypothetical protein
VHSVETQVSTAVGSAEPVSVNNQAPHGETQMSIEKALADLQAAVEANTAALLSAGGKASTPNEGAAETKGKPGRPPKDNKSTTRSVDRSAVNAALEEVKEKLGVEEAKGIIKNVGGADKRADIADAKLQAVYDACKAKIDAAADDEI